jgi:hypothetical protein
MAFHVSFKTRVISRGDAAPHVAKGINKFGERCIHERQQPRLDAAQFPIPAWHSGQDGPAISETLLFAGHFIGKAQGELALVFDSIFDYPVLTGRPAGLAAVASNRFRSYSLAMATF